MKIFLASGNTKKILEMHAVDKHKDPAQAASD